MHRFTDRHAVITGGTSGIGLGTARRIAEEGGVVLVTGVDKARLDAADAIDGVTAIAHDSADADPAPLRAAVDTHLSGRVDVLFLNAGLGAFAPIEAIEAIEFDRQFHTNVRGPFTQLAALESALSDGASVLFNTSVVNDVGMPMSTVYSATKGAVRSGMNVVANELAPRSIRVNAISPGPVDSGFFGRTGLGDDEIQSFAAQVLANIKVLGIPEEKLNICGGGIALGHPIGASGARVLTTLVHQHARTGGRRGIASLCLGGGNSVTVLVVA